MQLIGIGTARPDAWMTQEQAALAAADCSCETEPQRRLLNMLYRKTNVKKRGSVLLSNGVQNGGKPHAAAEAASELQKFYPPSNEPNGSEVRGPSVAARMQAYIEHALPMAERAVRRSLEKAGVRANQIDQLITVSCTGFAAPGVDLRLMDRLGMRPNAERTCVGFMGCHGALNGLRVGRALTRDKGGLTLMLAVELCTLHFQYGWETDRVVANALFSDGAAAVVGAGQAEGHTGWRVADNVSYVIPDSSEDMSWTIGDHGFEMTLSPHVPGRIKQCLREWISTWLREHKLTIENVNAWAIHPGGPRVIQSVEEALGLAPDAGEMSRQVLSECGNMSSPTVLFIIERLRQNGVTGPCVALAFGPGLTAEATLLI